MEENDAGSTVPAVEAEHEGLQVSPAAENGGGGGGHEEAVAVANGVGEGGFREKRKRGRPRKQLGDIQPEFRVVAEGSGGPQKRGRGRPRGSGKWQTLAASLGLSSGQTGGSSFTPYIIEIQAGENIVERIWSFSQMTCDSICILSASGTISTAEIFLPASRGRFLRYEGHYSIVCLNGSHTYDEKSNGKTCLLSVQLANADGRFYGGAVAGSLIADGPTQIIVSTFKQNSRQQARPNVSAPTPNPNENGRVAVAPLQPENGRLIESEVREGEEEQEQVEDGPIFNGPNVGQPASPQTTDWKSLQPQSNV